MPDGQDREEHENPYVGPRPFERNDSRLFFGREAETRELLSLVIADPIVVVYAASGAGKSSLLNAGLVPLLDREERFEVFPTARLGAGMGEQHLTSARNVYMRGVLLGWAKDTGSLASGAPEGSLAEFLARVPHPRGEDGLPSPRALIFDQFEELFTGYPAHWRQRPGYLEQIGQALDDDPLLRVVFAIREDYLAELDAHASLLPGDLRSRYRLERLGQTKALSAVTRPAQTTNRRFAPGVAERLVSNLLTLRIDAGSGKAIEVEGEFVEPVQLQVTCRRLWSELPADIAEITSDHLRAYGDVDEVLASFYDNVVRETAAAAHVREPRLRRWVDKVLITSVGTRGTVYRAAESTAGLPNEAVEELEDRHLIRPEWRAGARWYELTHDRLIEPIRASNARAERARRRRQRILMSSGVLVLLLAAAAVFFTSVVKQQQPKLAQRVAVSSARTTYNVTYSGYLRMAGGSLRGVSSEALAVRGNLVAVNVATSGYRGEALVITPSTRDPRTRRSLTINSPAPTSPAGFAPKTDVESSVRPVWIPLPERTGRFLYTVRVTGAGVPLAIAETPVFDVNASDVAKQSFVARPVPSARPTSVLAVAVTGSGRGNVTSSPAGVSCPGDCTATLASGTTVVLSATPDPVSVFAGWRGGHCGGTGECVLTVRGARTTVATFESRQPPRPTLTLTTSASGPGSITPDCSHGCSYPTGALVSLTARPDPGASLQGWTGCAQGAHAACVLRITEDRRVSASFVKVG